MRQVENQKRLETFHLPFAQPGQLWSANAERYANFGMRT